MTTKLRTLLVAAVVLSTLLVGMRDTLAAVRAAAGRDCSIEGESFRDSREDDSGTRSEQVEEGDGDEEEGREVHFLGTDSLACRPDQVVRAPTPPPRCCAAHLHSRAALVRGPPTRG